MRRRLKNELTNPDHLCVPTCLCVCPLKSQGSFWNVMPDFFTTVDSRGAVGILEVTAQRRHFKFAVIWNLDADCTHLREDDHHSFPFGPLCN